MGAGYRYLCFKEEMGQPLCLATCSSPQLVEVATNYSALRCVQTEVR